MKTYINAGFGELLGTENLKRFKFLGFDGVRQDVPSGHSRELVFEFANFPALAPLFLVCGGKMRDIDIAPTVAWAVAACMQEFACKGAIEIGNEPDLTGHSPLKFAQIVTECARGVWAIDPEIPVVLGGVMATNERGLGYLEATLDAGIPRQVSIGYHTYRPGSPDVPNPGFKSRDGEFHRLKNLANGRPLWNTEIGWHTSSFKEQRAFPFCFLTQTVQHTDETVFKFLVREKKLNTAAGAEIMTVYQHRDGPSAGQKFGITRLDGSLKPSSQIARA